MSLTNEDLFAISQLLDVKLDARLKPIENDIRDMKGEIISLKDDMRFVKIEIAALKDDMRSVKSEIAALKDDMQSVKSEIAVLKDDMQSVKGNIVSLETEIHKLKLSHENIILPRLNTIESCYTSTYNRYKEYADRMDAAFVDIDLLKKVAETHSEQIQKLA